MKAARSWLPLAVPSGIILLMGLLTLFGATRLFELQILDFYTRMIPSPPERSEVVLIDVDDLAMQTVGTWPWSRDVHAEVLADLRSLGADSLSFDVEFVDRGPVGVNSAERDEVLASQRTELELVFQAWEDKQMGASEVKEAAQVLLEEGVLLTARDNDAYLGRAMRVFGRAFTTLNYDQTNDNAAAREAEAYYQQNSFLTPVSGDLSRVKQVETLRGAIVPIAGQAAGAAVTNVEKDLDGTLRRINLLFRHGSEGKVYGQLAFVPVWVRLGKPPIEVFSDRIVLRTSALPQNPQPDLVIPLDPDGLMIINWPHTTYRPSFTHVLVSELQTLRAQEASVARQVQAMQDAGYLTQDLTGMHLQAKADRSRALAEGDQTAFDAADVQEGLWRSAVGDLASGTREAELKALLEQQFSDPAIPRSSKDKIPGLVADVQTTFSTLRAKVQSYFDLRADLESRLKGALAFYGWTAVATTDVGVTPFDSVYFNVGTHASIANTLLSGAFLNEWPSWASFLLGAVLAGLAAFVLTRTGSLGGVVLGFGIFAVLLAGVGVGYALTGVYAGAFVSGGTVFLTVLGLTLVRFWGTEAEKRYIRGAFSTYLSPEVIKQLEADPDKLKLGGEKKVLTAVFTDVKGFSTVSEGMDPNDLVTLLNHYLTGMSDLILDTRGTIDKFEGDAIIAFWGAPLAFEDHAQAAVQAALRMKQAEGEMNQRFLRENLAPTPLLTRIGINTGEMTVGNMGTARRMDYTMMGNAVNLAARLEGVNKQYGTWILTSQSTRDRLDDTILVRKLDRVRVVGISTPVRLFEVHSFRSEASAKTLEKISLFEAGIDAYEAQNWDKARGLFHEVLALDPTDGPAKTFVERAEANKGQPPRPDWDGVFSLTSK